MSVYSEASVKLVQDLKRCKDSKLLPLPAYRDDLVREVKREIQYLYAEMRRWSEEKQAVEAAAGLEEDGASTPEQRQQRQAGLDAAISMHHLAILRSKRCLLAYTKWRADYLARAIWELGADTSAASALPAAVKKSLSPAESTFLTRYAKLTTEYRNNYLDVDLAAAALPPKDPFVEVRVVRDCGTVETERGSIRLKEHSTQYLRRTDVEPFITKGWLQHIG